ncbi:chemotaxis protein CheW [Solirubrobacter soli]|uniref:chemotaxis protein CheW n=1 Tax=Solirubrobacter soli TaxID=363832 RepID=UPI0004024EBB|nr:chemotaxis protein CheW [Solirubrobacter soli]
MTPQQFDWDLARERLAAARDALDARLSPAEEQALLEERARALATPPEAGDADGNRDVVRFTLCGESFAVAAEHVLEALPLGEPTPVPGTPPFLLGVVNHRGRVLPVMDLRRQLVPQGDAAAELTDTVAVSVDGVTFGIAAEAVEETTGETLDEALVTVLDLEALAADPRLRIDDE